MSPRSFWTLVSVTPLFRPPGLHANIYRRVRSELISGTQGIEQAQRVPADNLDANKAKSRGGVHVLEKFVPRKTAVPGPFSIAASLQIV